MPSPEGLPLFFGPVGLSWPVLEVAGSTDHACEAALVWNFNSDEPLIVDVDSDYISARDDASDASCIDELVLDSRCVHCNFSGAAFNASDHSVLCVAADYDIVVNTQRCVSSRAQSGHVHHIVDADSIRYTSDFLPRIGLENSRTKQYSRHAGITGHRSISSSALSPARDRHAGRSLDRVSRRNFMRTFGRRMHAKARCEFSVSSRPAQCLEEMNLGEVVPLTPDEARDFQCRDVRGRIVDGVYSAPVVRTAVPNAVGSRVVTSIKKVAVLQNEMSSLNIMSDPCVADAWAGRKSAGVIRMGP